MPNWGPAGSLEVRQQVANYAKLMKDTKKARRRLEKEGYHQGI